MYLVIFFYFSKRTYFSVFKHLMSTKSPVVPILDKEDKMSIFTNLVFF